MIVNLIMVDISLVWSRMYGDEISILAESARQGLSEFLKSYPWTFWFTATSKTPCRYPRQAIGRVLGALAVTNRGFVGAERHKSGFWHTHGLLFTSIEPGAQEGARILYHSRLSKYGYSRVESARSQEAVSAYVSKYITKDLDGDWEIWGTESWGKNHQLT